MSLSRSLFNMPKDPLDIIVSFCGLPEILCLESTRSDANEKIKSVWLKLMAERNLFIGLTHDKKTQEVSYYGFSIREKKEVPTSNWDPTPKKSKEASSIHENEIFQDNPKDYFKSQQLSTQEKKHILQGNQAFLNRMQPFVDRQSQIPIYEQTAQSCSHNPYLTMRAQKTPWKRCYFQIIEQDRASGMNSELKVICPSNIATLHHFVAGAFKMLDLALENGQTELFTLLDRYSFTMAMDKVKGRTIFLKAYIRQCNFLIFNEIQRTRPLTLDHFFRYLSSNQPTVSFTSLFRTESFSGSQEEDKKVSEENEWLINSLNIKYSQSTYVDWPIHIPMAYQNKTPLRYAIELAHKASDDFNDKHRTDLDPNENSHLKVVKVLINAKAAVDEPGLWTYVITRVRDLDIVKVLVKGKANVNETLPGQTVLGTALAQLGRPEKMHKLLSVLLKAKADVNEYDSEQWTTPLMFAAENCASETVKYLLDRGANHLDFDKKKNTCLAYAVKTMGNVEKMKMLLSFKIVNFSNGKKHVVRLSGSINQINAEGHTILAKAIMADHPGTASYVKLLMAAGADPRLLPVYLRIPDHIMPLLYPQEYVTPQKGVKRKGKGYQ